MIVSITDICLVPINIYFISPAIEQTKSNRGLALEDIVTELHLFIMRRKYVYIFLISLLTNFILLVELPMSVMNKLIVKMAQVEERLSKGCSEAAQTAALVSAFFISRDMVSLES